MGTKGLSFPRNDEAVAFMNRIATRQVRGALGYDVPIFDCEVELPGYTSVDFFESDEKFLESSLAQLKRRVWGHDHGVPMIMPGGCGGGVLATAFGARYEPARSWTHPVATRPEEIEDLPLDVTLNDGLIPQALESVEYIVSQTDGEVPLQLYGGVGGPMDVATMVMNDQAFLEAMYLYPEAAHRLLDVCTDLWIAFVKAQQEIVPHFVPTLLPVYWPDGMGVLCGEDWLSVISPKMALEFEIPYINRISDAFGGVIIHACGRLEINFETLKNHVRNLRGVNFNTGWSSYPKAVEIFNGTDVMLLPSLGLQEYYHYDSPIDWVKRLLAGKPPDVSVFLFAPYEKGDPGQDPNVTSREIMEMIRKYKSDGLIE